MKIGIFRNYCIPRLLHNYVSELCLSAGSGIVLTFVFEKGTSFIQVIEGNGKLCFYMIGMCLQIE